MRVWMLWLLLVTFAVPSPARAQCACQWTDPYGKLTPAEHREKFDALLTAASAAYGRTLSAVRAGDLPAAKREAIPFARAWEEVFAGFLGHPPKGLEKTDPWAKWLPVAHERLCDGVQQILSGDDLKAGLRSLEGGRWALVRLREENGAPLLPDLVLRGRQVEGALRLALASGDSARTGRAAKRLGELASAASRHHDPPEVGAWGQKAASAAASLSAGTLAAAREASERLHKQIGDRLN